MATLLDPDAIGMSYAPKLRDHVAMVPVEHEAILYEEGEGILHQLNSTAAAVCTLFDGQANLDTLIDDLVAVFGADRATVEADVLTVTRELGHKGLLEGVRGDGEDSQADATDDTTAPASSEAAPDA